MDIEALLDRARIKRKRIYRDALMMSISVGAITLLAVLINLLMSYSIIILFPILVVPFLICTMIGTMRISMEKDYSFRSYHKFYFVGLSPTVLSGFKLFSTYFKALLIAFIAIALGMGVLFLIPEYKDLMNELADLLRNGTAVEYINIMNEFISNHEAVMGPAVDIIFAIGEGVAIFYFMFVFFKRLLFVFAKVNALLPEKSGYKIFNKVFSKHRRKYYKGLLKFTWFSPVFIPLVYLLGAAIAFYTERGLLMSSLGIMLVILTLIPLLPSILIYNEEIYGEISNELQVQNSEFLLKVLEEVKSRDNLTPEQKEELLKILGPLKDNLIKVKKEEASIPATAEEKKEEHPDLKQGSVVDKDEKEENK